MKKNLVQGQALLLGSRTHDDPSAQLFPPNRPQLRAHSPATQFLQNGLAKATQVGLGETIEVPH